MARERTFVIRKNNRDRTTNGNRRDRAGVITSNSYAIESSIYSREHTITVLARTPCNFGVLYRRARGGDGYVTRALVVVVVVHTRAFVS